MQCNGSINVLIIFGFFLLKSNTGALHHNMDDSFIILPQPVSLPSNIVMSNLIK
jgi:hypothetical protein